MRKTLATILMTIVCALPVTAAAAPDPHTNITPLEEYVAQEIKAFNEYVAAAEEDGVIVNLPDALDDLAGVLESYLRLSQR